MYKLRHQVLCAFSDIIKRRQESADLSCLVHQITFRVSTTGPLRIQVNMNLALSLTFKVIQMNFIGYKIGVSARGHRAVKIFFKNFLSLE